MSYASRKLWKAKLEGRPVRAAKQLHSSLPTQTSKFRGLILGIDPSLRGTGLVVVEVSSRQAMSLLHCDTVKLKSTVPFTEALGCIGDRIQEIIRNFPIDHVAIEETIYVQNARTAQKLGAARGAAIAVASMRQKPVFEYPPLSVKQAVVGHGRASKLQVAGMVRSLLKLNQALPEDESDAAAVAICHLYNLPS